VSSILISYCQSFTQHIGRRCIIVDALLLSILTPEITVVATLAENKGKQVTLTITDAKTPINFKVTIEFSPPHGGEQPLAGI